MATPTPSSEEKNAQEAMDALLAYYGLTPKSSAYECLAVLVPAPTPPSEEKEEPRVCNGQMITCLDCGLRYCNGCWNVCPDVSKHPAPPTPPSRQEWEDKKCNCECHIAESWGGQCFCCPKSPHYVTTSIDMKNDTLTVKTLTRQQANEIMDNGETVVYVNDAGVIVDFVYKSKSTGKYTLIGGQDWKYIMSIHGFVVSQYFQPVIQSILHAHNQRLVEEILDDLWEQSQKDSKGFGKAYSYLVLKFKPAVITNMTVEKP